MDYFSPAAITDGSGALTERYAFTAFGLRSILAPDFSHRSSSECSFGFAFQGQFLDSESGLLDYGFRYYSPFLGRLLSRDPILEAGGLNLYSYTSNNPPNLTDFLGLDGQGGAQMILNQALNTPLIVARSQDGTHLYGVLSPFPTPNWFGKNKCNLFVWDSVNTANNNRRDGGPDPTKATKDGMPIYPTAADVKDPSVTIPGYGPPHLGPFAPGDIVTNGAHMGIQDSDGVWQASTNTGTVYKASPDKFSPGWGRTPIK